MWHSPNLYPIEMAYAKLKAHLRGLKARTFDALFNAVAPTCELFPQNSAGTSPELPGTLRVKWTML